MIALSWWLMSLLTSESFCKPELKGRLTWELKLYKGSPVLATFCENAMRAKLSILKSGQGRLTLQTSSLSLWVIEKSWQQTDRHGKTDQTETNWNMKVTSGKMPARETFAGDLNDGQKSTSYSVSAQKQKSISSLRQGWRCSVMSEPLNLWSAFLICPQTTMTLRENSTEQHSPQQLSQKAGHQIIVLCRPPSLMLHISQDAKQLVPLPFTVNRLWKTTAAVYSDNISVGTLKHLICKMTSIIIHIKRLKVIFPVDFTLIMTFGLF